MTSRWFALLLCAVLAAPLCCCGWHGLDGATVAAAEPVCLHCQEAADLAPENEESCPCLSQLTQRDLAPRMLALEMPAWAFALLAETSEFSPPAWLLAADYRLPARAGPLPAGPTRLFIRHRALLC